jgi:uridine kinase
VTGAREELIAEVAGMVTARDACRVAVDGVDGAGKTTFAGELAGALRAQGRPVVQVSADGFHQVRALRHRRGVASPEGFWLDSYDYPALIHNVLAPFGPGGSRRYRRAVHDVATDEVLAPPRVSAPVDAVLVVDGLFLHRDELAGCWDFSVLLTAPFAVTAARMAQRDGTHPEPEHPSMARYVRGQRLYFAACRPWERADLVIDNSDLEGPAFVRGW